MQMQVSEVEREIRSYLIEEFLFGRSETLDEDTPLLGNVIDSQGVIQLVSFIQQQFNIEIADEEVTTENLATLKSVVALVSAKVSSPS
ncbi:MAG TPA: acyl carrier protein [Candidatus Binatia bacterium]|jgi:acyl carrier protein|nr:acyl carrier protein [Candidatus Binatia bacterium]